MTIANAPVTTKPAPVAPPPGLTRQQACALVVQGLNSLRDGLLRYQELGLSTQDLYEDLKASGWDKSLRTLQRIAKTLRNEGLLPQTNQGQRTDVPKPVTSDIVSPPLKAEHVATKSEPSERLFSVSMVEGLQRREIELMEENESLKSELVDLKDKVEYLQELLKDNSIDV